MHQDQIHRRSIVDFRSFVDHPWNLPPFRSRDDRQMIDWWIDLDEHGPQFRVVTQIITIKSLQSIYIYIYTYIHTYICIFIDVYVYTSRIFVPPRNSGVRTTHQYPRLSH